MPGKPRRLCRPRGRRRRAQLRVRDGWHRRRRRYLRHHRPRLLRQLRHPLWRSMPHRRLLVLLGLRQHHARDRMLVGGRSLRRGQAARQLLRPRAQRLLFRGLEHRDRPQVREAANHRKQGRQRSRGMRCGWERITNPARGSSFCVVGYRGPWSQGTSRPFPPSSCFCLHCTLFKPVSFSLFRSGTKSWPSSGTRLR